MSPDIRAARVGLVILAAVAILAVGIFIIGDKNNLFSRKNLYYVDFNSAGGLKPGSPVELSGVDVGTIKRVDLPEDPQKRQIRVWLEVESRYGGRVRGPSGPSQVISGQPASVARIKTLGLLGDKYVEISSGSPAYPVIPSGGPIPASQPTNVDALIASGEDVMDNVVQISHSLNAILDRMERGEGILGQLTKDTPESRRLQESLVGTSESLQRIASTIEHGEGPLPRLLNDRALAEQLARSLDRFEGVLAQVQQGPGLLPGLLNDASTRAEFNETLASLHKVASDLEQFTADLETSDALLPKLVKDEEYGREVADQVRQFVRRLNEISYKVSEGEGSAAKLINDPQIYQAVNDVIIGVNESRLLRWLIRNRQKKGIEKRYQDTTKAIEAQGGTPEPLDAGPDATAKPADRPKTAAPPVEETPPPSEETPPPDPPRSKALISPTPPLPEGEEGKRSARNISPRERRGKEARGIFRGRRHPARIPGRRGTDRMHVLVTGGAGFIGSHLTRRLLARGDRVTVLDDFNDFYDPARKRENVGRFLGREDYRLAEGDIRDEALVDGLFAAGRFDAVVHLAARAGVRPSLREPILYEDVNCIGTLRLLEAARRHGPQTFIFGSSSSVYGINEKVPFAENDEINQPISPYATTKRTGELLCYNYHHLYGLRTACLRFFTVYGPGQRPEMAIHKFTDLLWHGKAVPMYGDGSSRRDYTYVDDIVDGLVASLDLAPGFEILNLGGADTTSLADLVHWIAEELAVEPRIDYLPAQPGDVPITYADVSKAARLLGYSPKVPIREGLRRFVSWYRERAERSHSETSASEPGKP